MWQIVETTVIYIEDSRVLNITSVVNVKDMYGVLNSHVNLG